MYFHIMIGTGSYTTSTTNMYNKYRFHVPVVECHSDSATLQGMLCHMRGDRVQSVQSIVRLDHFQTIHQGTRQKNIGAAPLHQQPCIFGIGQIQVRNFPWRCGVCCC